MVRFDLLDELNAFSMAGNRIIAKMRGIFSMMTSDEAAAVAVYVFEREAATIA